MKTHYSNTLQKHFKNKTLVL